LLDVAYDWNRLPPPSSLKAFEARWAERSNPLNFSGVWRFRDLLPLCRSREVLTIGEGQTILQRPTRWPATSAWSRGGCNLQYERHESIGSFKDNGMTAAFTHARTVGARRAACASTGNNQRLAGGVLLCHRLMRAIIFIGSGKISYGKTGPGARPWCPDGANCR